ncbi:MAG: NUDIX domain-containing protein, partial [Bacteroides sp.]|nr:NUDIX domain-containing protein [Bacteroides sp.]
RVLSRWLSIDTPIDSTSGKKQFAEAAAELLDRHRPSMYNQAIMEFGALQCTPVSPRCAECPLAESCAALQQNKVDSLPVKQHKTKVTNRFFNYIYVRMGAYTYINKRRGNDIWRNLYELPLIETEEDIAEKPEVLFARLEDMLGKTMFSEEENIVLREGKHRFVRLVRQGVKHVLSHRVIYVNFYEVVLPADAPSLEGFLRVPIKELHKFAVPNLVSQFFSLILEP